MRRALHSSHPDNLLCREKEIAEIRSFLHNHLPKGKPGSLYISGAPGTGKTACLTRIMLEMKVNEMTTIKAKSYWWWSRLIMYICYKNNTWMIMIVAVLVTLADPDLQMRGRGGASRPWDKGGGGKQSLKKFFSALPASVWSKDRGGRPPGPLPCICHWVMIIMY